MDEHGILPIASFLDVGCGQGQWLAAAHNLLLDGPLVGVDLPHHQTDVDRVVAESVLVAERQPFHFVPYDLNAIEPVGKAVASLTEPLGTSLTYDLVNCVEVAEHLQPGTEAGLVHLVTMLAGKGVVLWSAAQPGQGPYDPDNPMNPGTHHNERWLWEWDALFSARGFSSCDLIRPEIWTDQRIDWWYRANTVLYVSESCPISPWQDELGLISQTILRKLAARTEIREA
jgi:SAM-dependent methyltransferase